ncbi:hypothetical protein SHO565_15250 [Streptomyces sp. HO565]
MACGQGPAPRQQRGRIAEVHDGVIGDVRLLPRGFGAGEQHDSVGVRDLLKAVAAVVLISGSDDKYNRASGQEGILRIEGRQGREKGVSQAARRRRSSNAWDQWGWSSMRRRA